MKNTTKQDDEAPQAVQGEASPIPRESMAPSAVSPSLFETTDIEVTGR